MAQYARPDSDVAASNFTGSYTAIDESPASDSDYLSGSSSANGYSEHGLSDVSDPVSSTAHVMRCRACKSASGGHARSLDMVLYQDSTVIKTYACASDLPYTFTDYTCTLTSGEADSITDYSALKVRFVSGGTVGTPPASRRYVYVSWFEFEVPDAGGGTTYYSTPAGTFTPAGGFIKAGRKVLAGAITPAGTLLKAGWKSLSGALAPGGAQVKQTAKLLSATLTPVGALVKSTVKVFTGALTSSGLSAAVKTILRALAGVLAPAGSLLKQTRKALPGLLTPAGAAGLVKTAAPAVLGKVTGFILRVMQALGYDRLVMAARSGERLLEAAEAKDERLAQCLGSDRIINKVLGSDKGG